MTPDEIRAGVDAVREWVDEYPEATVLASRSIVLPRPERREVVGRLRQEGMSTRAIASAVGTDHSTVVRDLQSTGASAPVEVTSLDGRTRPATRPQPEPEPVEAAS